MALSQLLKEKCPTCGKVAVEKDSIDFGEYKLVTLQCGHCVTDNQLKNQAQNWSVTNLLGTKELLPYQIDGVKFAEESNIRCLIADEQGLGKTIQAIAIIKLHKEEVLPAIVAVPSSVKLQWLHQFIDWCGLQGYLCQVISSGKEKAIPGFQIYIVSYDMLKNEEQFSMVMPNIKLVIADEVQRIKNHLSDRAKAIQRICKDVEHIVFLSGTPIENNAGEYFTVCNILRPRRFPHYQKFLDEFCDYYWNGYGNKVGGLKDRERFHDMTKDFIIRRTKAEVLKDLPEFRRDFYHVAMSGKFGKAYNNLLDDLEELMYSDESNVGAAKIAIMSKMRHITGISKVEEATDFTLEFLESCDRKLTIFTHHLDVAELLQKKIVAETKGACQPLMFTSALSSDDRQAIVEKFRDTMARVMIASTQAAGVGLNLQFCSDSIMLERQWNPSKEKQAEDRFHRIGQKNNVVMTYMIASETIDEYFTELVESKRAIVASALDNQDYNWNESGLMSELAAILVAKGKKKWSL